MSIVDQPLGSDELRVLSTLIGGALPAPFVWWLTTYGAALEFVEPVVGD